MNNNILETLGTPKFAFARKYDIKDKYFGLIFFFKYLRKLKITNTRFMHYNWLCFQESLQLYFP